MSCEVQYGQVRTAVLDSTEDSGELRDFCRGESRFIVGHVGNVPHGH